MEVAGTRQSGFLKLRFASLTEDFDSIERAKNEVDSILENDPGLVDVNNSTIREVLLKAPPFEEQHIDN